MTKWTKRQVEAKDKDKAATAALKAQQVKTAKAEATMKRAGGEAKKILAARAAAKADSILKKQKKAAAIVALKAAQKAKAAAEASYEEAVVNEETAMSKVVALQRAIGVKAFQQKWDAIKREVRMNSQDFKKLQECNKGTEWVC